MNQDSGKDPYTGVYVLVNGYGAPADPLTDGNYHRYLNAVFDFVDRYTTKEVTLILAGGFTNREDLSEADAMQMWFENNQLTKNVKVVILNHTVSARDNVRAAYSLLKDMPLHVFCEYSRRFIVECITMQFFSSYVMHPVAFDEVSMQRSHRVKQLFLHLPLEILACYFYFAERARLRLRLHHIMQARRRSRKLSKK